MAAIGMPTGSIVAFGGAVAPPCWLLCDGSSYLRLQWSALFAVIGVAYGSADADHFNVPDFRGRSPLGVSPGFEGSVVRPTARARGESGGEEGHLLVLTELAAHDHGGVTGGFGLSRVSVADLAAGGEKLGVDSPNHAHGISSAGGGLRHNTLHPFQVSEWIIKT